MRRVVRAHPSREPRVATTAGVVPGGGQNPGDHHQRPHDHQPLGFHPRAARGWAASRAEGFEARGWARFRGKKHLNNWSVRMFILFYDVLRTMFGCRLCFFDLVNDVFESLGLS